MNFGLFVSKVQILKSCQQLNSGSCSASVKVIEHGNGAVGLIHQATKPSPLDAPLAPSDREFGS